MSYPSPSPTSPTASKYKDPVLSSLSNGTGLRPPSRLVTPLLLLLIPAGMVGLALLPVLAGLCLLPVVGFFSFPTFISLAFFLVYSISWTIYLLVAQRDPPVNVRLPFLPWSPTKSFKVTLYFFQLLSEAFFARALHLIMESQVRRVVVLGGRDKKSILKENILYREGEKGELGKRLDVYLPVKRFVNTETGSSHNGNGTVSEGDSLAPVIVFVGGGNWTWWKRSHGAQVALQLRRRGYCVVVPDLTQWPKGKCGNTVSDLRYVLRWTAESIQTYGGNPNNIFLFGYGSGAHISLLTLVQDAVVHSRDEHLARIEMPTRDEASLYFDNRESAPEVTAGIRQCHISGSEDVELPQLAGLILLSGAYDLIKQLRWESLKGIEDVSALRRACGPSTGAILLNDPSHLLYASKEFLEPDRLPPKILIIAGGKDQQVLYGQSVLISKLLSGVGVENLRLKLYQMENHFGSLGSLMHHTRYSGFIMNEIDSIITSEY